MRLTPIWGFRGEKTPDFFPKIDDLVKDETCPVIQHFDYSTFDTIVSIQVVLSDGK